MFVVNDEQQRQKMTEEFYANYKRDLEFYQQRIQTFIDNGCDSKAVIKRWIQKIDELQKKKQVYEDVLKQQLNELDSDFALLTMQANELQVRNIKGQMTIPLAAQCITINRQGDVPLPVYLFGLHVKLKKFYRLAQSTTDVSLIFLHLLFDKTGDTDTSVKCAA